jgi:hypothetical protein
MLTFIKQTILLGLLVVGYPLAVLAYGREEARRMRNDEVNRILGIEE